MKILVVDDDETNCQVLSKLLAKDNHEVVVANDGEQSVNAFRLENPDMVLMDVMMPVMDGYEAASKIKEISCNKFVPIIFITALDNDEALVRCLASGGDDFISKPFKIPVLRAKIAAMERIRALQLAVEKQNQLLVDIHERNAREMIIAEDIFNKVIASGCVDSEVFRNFHKPADTFNGDLVMAMKSPRGCLNVMIGDFTGHGIAAAMCSMPVVDTFSKMSVRGHSINKIISEISHKIKSVLPVERFYASCFLSVDWKEKTLKIWNGGMPDVYVYNKDKGLRLTIPSAHLPLGIVSADNIDTTTEVYPLEEGDRIFAYSDGLIELDVGQEEMFGDERLKSIIQSNLDNKDIVKVIEQEISSYSTELKDDVTFLEVNCNFDKLAKIKITDANAITYGNWSFTFNLDIETIRNMDPVPILLSCLEEMQEIREHRDSLFTILSEMYANSLEHGILGMSSEVKQSLSGFNEYYEEVQRRLADLKEGHIIVSFSHEKHGEGCKLTISMTDSGDGFDVSSIIDSDSNKTGELKSGRGLLLIRHLAKDCWFNDKGNQFNASLEWGGF